MTTVHFDNSNGDILQNLAKYMTFRNWEKMEDVGILWYCANNNTDIATKLWELIYCITDSGGSSPCESNTDSILGDILNFDMNIEEECRNYNINAKVDDDFIVEVISEYEYEH